MLLSQVLDTRDDLTELRRQHPILAKRFLDLRERLDTPATASITPESASAARPGRAAEERRRLADQFAAALREIRATDGFARELGDQAVPVAEQLQRAVLRHGRLRPASLLEDRQFLSRPQGRASAPALK